MRINSDQKIQKDALVKCAYNRDLCDIAVFILCLVDFEKQDIPSGIDTNTHFKDEMIRLVKKELEELQDIDNVIKVLLKTDDFDFQKGVGIYPIQFLENQDNIPVKYYDETITIEKRIIDKLIQGYRVLYVVECTIYVPVLTSPKWVKGLIREKDFELQIFAPGFTVEDAKFHLEVTKYDSVERELLQSMAGGRLLILYMRFSQLS